MTLLKEESTYWAASFRNGEARETSRHARSACEGPRDESNDCYVALKGPVLVAVPAGATEAAREPRSPRRSRPSVVCSGCAPSCSAPTSQRARAWWSAATVTWRPHSCRGAASPASMTSTPNWRSGSSSVPTGGCIACCAAGPLTALPTTGQRCWRCHRWHPTWPGGTARGSPVITTSGSRPATTRCTHERLGAAPMCAWTSTAWLSP
jgi:hypothetical protein